MGELSQRGRQRRDFEKIVIAAGALVSIRLPVPVPTETKHPDVHPSAAPYNRNVAGYVSVDQGATQVDATALLLERHAPLHMKGAGRDLHYPYVIIGAR
jgi:hypothetical protein